MHLLSVYWHSAQALVQMSCCSLEGQRFFKTDASVLALTLTHSPYLPPSRSVCVSVYSQGTIVPARGPNEFGWDPIFQPDGFDKTYAELETIVKNSISHRYKAVTAMREHFVNISSPTVKKLKTANQEQL